MSQQIMCDGCDKPIAENAARAQVEILHTAGGRTVLHFHAREAGELEGRCFEESALGEYAPEPQVAPDEAPTDAA